MGAWLILVDNPKPMNIPEIIDALIGPVVDMRYMKNRAEIAKRV